MVADIERGHVIRVEAVEVTGEAVPAKPDGPLAAVLVAAGIGSFILGLVTTLAEASTGFRERLVLNAGVGPLSGKTVWATVAFFAAWAILHYLWRGRDQLLRAATLAFVILTLLGLLGTFPIFFQAFAGE